MLGILLTSEEKKKEFLKSIQNEQWENVFKSHFFLILYCVEYNLTSVSPTIYLLSNLYLSLYKLGLISLKYTYSLYCYVNLSIVLTQLSLF